MSDSEAAKKAYEENRLNLFLDAYFEVTGLTLDTIVSGERPDFVCRKPDSSEVGIELTRSPHDYDLRIHDAIWTDGTLDAFELLDAVYQIVAAKSPKIKQANWRTAETILVVFLEDYTFESLGWVNDSGLAADFADYGFSEIWLADCSTIEPYSAVRLIGLHPQNHWGPGHQPSLTGKPFG